MTDPVIRALSASDAHLFDALPDPLGAREGHRRTRFRPDWKRVGTNSWWSASCTAGPRSEVCPSGPGRLFLPAGRAAWRGVARGGRSGPRAGPDRLPAPACPVRWLRGPGR